MTTTPPTSSDITLRSPLELLAKAGVSLTIDSASETKTLFSSDKSLRVYGTADYFGICPEQGVLTVKLNPQSPEHRHIITKVEYRLETKSVDGQNQPMHAQANGLEVTISGRDRVFFLPTAEQMDIFSPDDATWVQIPLSSYESRRQQLNPTR